MMKGISLASVLTGNTPVGMTCIVYGGISLICTRMETFDDELPFSVPSIILPKTYLDSSSLNICNSRNPAGKDKCSKIKVQPV